MLMRPSAKAAAVMALWAGVLAAHGAGWSWSEVDRYAPDPALFPARGSAQVEFGTAFAAPGAPADKQALYGVIRYRDALDNHRDYDLFFQPTAAIWKIWRYESRPNSYAQYVGGRNYDNCQDGFVTATDRVFMPALGATNAVDAGLPGSELVTAVRTNYGCRNNHYSQPFPIDNYQGAGSGSGVIPELIQPPVWNAGTQTLYASSLSVPWVYYDGVLIPTDPRFLGDFASYSAAIRSFIQDQIRNALDSVRLESQIRILPDGTIMWTHIWTDLKGRPWVPNATDGYWLAADSSPNGRVFYFDPVAGTYVEPFANGQNPNGMVLTTGNGWVGYFIDPLRPDFGLGIYYHKPGGISINPAYYYPWGPSVVATNYSTNLPIHGSVFRQMFFSIGTKEQMQALSAILNNYVFVFTIGDGIERLCGNGLDDDGDGFVDCADLDCVGSSACGALTCIAPTSAQDGSVYGGSVDTASPYGLWGKVNGGGMAQVGIHTFPTGTDPAQVVQAVLRVPRTDNAWTADASALNLRMLVKHIRAGQDTAVSPADGTSASLGLIGVYREPGPYVLDNRRLISFDVTAQVRAELAAGRHTFAWRIEPQSVPDAISSQRYFPTIDNTDAAFGDLHGARLCLVSGEAPPREALCSDQLDNDGDGRTDCADLDCFGMAGCTTETLCSDGLDNDLDSFTDAADSDCTRAISIAPASAQDGHIIVALGTVDTVSPFASWGKQGGQPYVQVGIHSLPCGLEVADLAAAKLRIPQTDNLWTADESALNLSMILHHIDAAVDSAVTVADGISPALDLIGTYRPPGVYVADNARFVEYDVTQLVKADMAAGRRSFAWRIQPQSVPDTASSQRYFPSVDNTHQAFARENRGARLTLQVLAPTWGCPDADGDGDVDQSDFGQLQVCLSGPATPFRGNCQGFDFNLDGDVDQEDFGVFQKCLTGAWVPFDPHCASVP